MSVDQPGPSGLCGGVSGIETTGAPGAGAPVKTSAATVEDVQWKA